jgi:hypothetical protein
MVKTFHEVAAIAVIFLVMYINPLIALEIILIS